MADDELSAPLGQKAKAKPRRFKLPIAYLPQRRRRGARPVRLRLCRLGAVRRRPAGGEPVAMVATGLGPPKRAMPAVVSVNPAQGPRSYDGPGEAVTIPVPPMQAQLQPAAGATAAARDSARKTVTIIDGSTGKRQEVAIPGAAGGARAGRAAPARKLPAWRDPAHRAGRRPPGRGLRPPGQRRRRTRRTVRASPSCSTGLGVSANLTRRRSSKLPGPVTFAFRPTAPTSSAACRPRAPRATKSCCRLRWSRSTIRTTIPARRRC